MNTVIFLDIDGVLNDHSPMESRYNGTNTDCVAAFNRVLDAVPDAGIVVASAWRYMILKGQVTLAGFEMLLLTHGVKCHGRIVGHTRADGAIEDEPHHHDEPERWREAGLRWRAEQIMEWVREHGVENFVAIDDLPLAIPQLHQTDGTRGMTLDDAEAIVAMLVSGARYREINRQNMNKPIRDLVCPRCESQNAQRDTDTSDHPGVFECVDCRHQFNA